MKKVLVIVSMLCACGIAYYAANQTREKIDYYKWRYKITVEIETPEGIKTGSAVRQVEIKIEPRPPSIYDPPYHASHRVFGEAVVIDLGKRGVVFAAIPDGAYLDVTETIKGPPPLTIEGAKYYSSLRNVSKKLEPSKYPWFYAFEDLNNPKTVKIVKGGIFNIKKQKHTPVDRFEEIYGQGVKLKKVYVEITGDPVTWQIEEWLPWLPERKGMKGYLGGDSHTPFNDPTKFYLQGIDFSRGKYWLTGQDGEW